MRFLFLAAILLIRNIAAQTPESPHAKFIRDASLARGQELYETICITCHGSPEKEGTLPTSRPFWKEPFKNGGDPYSLFKTVTTGLGQMPAMAALTPEQRYDAVHYLREAFVKTHNPSAYTKIDAKYIASLPNETESLTPTSEMLEAEKGPPFLRMDFGPALFWTYQVAPENIAYKGIAIRLDEGPGGISQGRAWILYDHDTMRVAAAWTGDKFIDWRGIAFDGSHQTHASIVGEKILINPPGPSWANPKTGSFEDPRLRGRDNKPYGPLPRDWAHYKGASFHSNKVVIAYTVGDTPILEMPVYTNSTFTRLLNISKSKNDLALRLAPASTGISAGWIGGNPNVKLAVTNDFTTLFIPANATPIALRIHFGGSQPAAPDSDLARFTKPTAARWNQPLATTGKLGAEDGPFAVDEIIPPPDLANPWRTWMRFGGFDFFKDGKRAAICTWNGDVWIVSGIDGDLSQLIWKRICSGLFQPLGVKIVNEKIFVTCRDQIALLHDLNGDDEIDVIQNFNNDHQVTEHFHEFAMGLQTDAEGNFYYAKSARHALPAIVPHHGTLLKVSKDGSRTEIVANGFRAANGVCVNDDGTFFVTDQEGHWTPKNRINWVRPGRFYGNIFGYHNQTSTSDADMEQPLVWVTNEMDRSPGELVRVTSDNWGALKGALLNLSYGTGRIFLVPHENIAGQLQGGVVQLPIPDFPTGVMRGRFHPQNGHLYACGMFAWAGNKQKDGGFYRLRTTGKPTYLPFALHTREKSIQLQFTNPLDPAFATKPENYAIKAWSLNRTANYGSKHINEHSLSVTAATISADQKTITLTIPDLHQTPSMEIRATLRATNTAPFTRVIHNTIHNLTSPNL